MNVTKEIAKTLPEYTPANNMVLKSRYPKSDTTQIQGIGHVYGTPAGDLKVGDHMVWNGGSDSMVAGVAKETNAFITFYTVTSDGQCWTRKMKKTRIVARPADELPEAKKSS